jgi:5-methylcytosine-specific restriction endonuclease McrA
VKNLPPPTIDRRALYQTCVKQTQDKAVKALLLGMTSRIMRAGAKYSNAAASGRLHKVKKMQLGDRENAKLSMVYDRRMVPLTGRGRAAYDEIKGAAAKCPYCSDGEVYELDHFLPKAASPEFNVLPINLIPICHPCNHIKLERKPEGVRKYFLHPYFDQLPQTAQWLFAEIKRSGNGPVLIYRVELDPNGYGAVAHRLKYHFRELELDRRFKEASSTVLVELEAILDEHLGQFDADQIAAHYEDLGRRHLRLHGNKLEMAAYFAAAANKDYCAGCFRN